MSAKKGRNVVLIGCGNLAWHLAVRLTKLKFTISVYNHRANKDLLRFKTLNCRTYVGLGELDQNADLYFIGVSDSAIAKVSRSIKPQNKKAFVIHTAGARTVDELKNASGIKAVIYPLQSFSKTDTLNWQLIPLLIESDDKNAEKKLFTLAKSISPIVKKVSSRDRTYYHLSAVFINNFVNALHLASEELLNENVKNADCTLLDELSIHTLEKVFAKGARFSQTGPARRRDKVTMNAHRKLISNETSLLKVYNSLSKLIQEQNGKVEL